jgi:hypothetical protein
MREATIVEVQDATANWLFIDIGFSAEAASSGFLDGWGVPRLMTFAELCRETVEVCCRGDPPLHLLIEASLSVAFNSAGNPTKRSVEKRIGENPRYWYLGPGCGVMVAAMYLLRTIYDAQPRREIRLVEGFASFKPKGMKSSHAGDVLALRDVVWKRPGSSGRMLSPEELRVAPSDRLESAFAVAGMDFSVPPVVEVVS